MKELLMGNEAVALGAIAAGVRLAAGYPGTPSSEVLETLAKRSPGNIHVEWGVNEKAAVEAALGAAWSGARALATMKQVGLNVASDPVLCGNYMGVKGGLVLYVADDPGPISSQTEQDSRHFAEYAHIPVLDCGSPEEAYALVGEAFRLSERLGSPVLLRSTTRVCHACAAIELPALTPPGDPAGFQKDSRWVIFPRLSYQNKLRLAAQEEALRAEFSQFPYNRLTGDGPIGVVCGGVSRAYVKDALRGSEDQVTLLEVATPYPFPAALAARFLSSVRETIVFEELDPVLEDALFSLCGRQGLRAAIRGKRSGDVPWAGELSALSVGEILEKIFGLRSPIHAPALPAPPALPARPPVLCAGCPHRASFYAVKKAMAGRSCVFGGDIGCYTLGNAAPLDMVDTCLCMGAGITLAQGIGRMTPDALQFAFVGDSTFFASGITGVVNAVYNRAELILVVLDNSTTAMTGHQPHPGIGRTILGDPTVKVDIEAVLRGVGLTEVLTVDPLNHAAAVAAVKELAEKTGVRALIFRSPCAALIKNAKPLRVDTAACIGCQKCIRELGCPALRIRDGRAEIDEGLCVGCGLCGQICPKACIQARDGSKAGE